MPYVHGDESGWMRCTYTKKKKTQYLHGKAPENRKHNARCPQCKRYFKPPHNHNRRPLVVHNIKKTTNNTLLLRIGTYSFCPLLLLRCFLCPPLCPSYTHTRTHTCVHPLCFSAVGRFSVPMNSKIGIAPTFITIPLGKGKGEDRSIRVDSGRGEERSSLFVFCFCFCFAFIRPLSSIQSQHRYVV